VVLGVLLSRVVLSCTDMCVSSQIRGCPLRHFCNGATPPRR
jgi:hypothetical protein